MKQTMFIIMAATLCALLLGCGKDYQCNRYAPQNKEINWDDYNTVSTVANYFCGYFGTVKAHAGDTVMIKGYVVMDSRQHGYGGMVDNQTITISDKPGLYGYNAHQYSEPFWITSHNGFDFLTDYSSNQLVYFKGILNYEQLEGCDFNVSIII